MAVPVNGHTAVAHVGEADPTPTSCLKQVSSTAGEQLVRCTPSSAAGISAEITAETSADAESFGQTAQATKKHGLKPSLTL